MQHPSISLLLIPLLSILLTACGSDSDHSPSITLNGASSIEHIQGYSYEDQGASAVDLNGTPVDVFIRSDLNINTQGTYTVTYVATDENGRSSTINRTVIVISARPFITTWKVTGPGEEIYIGTWGNGYDYQVDWGDGKIDSHVNEGIAHAYAKAGTYTVTISGTFPQIYYSSFYASCYRLQSIEQWGDIQWRSMHKAFYRCSNISINATDAPNLSGVTDMSSMFEYSSLEGDINHWDVSNIINMQQTFSRNHKGNPALSDWNVSNVTNMKAMFSHAFEFNQDIGQWDVSSTTNMESMFESSRSFNQDISLWDVSSVINMKQTFFSAKEFNQNIDSWDVSNVENMEGMFRWAISFNQPLENWNVSSVKNIAYIFEGAALFDQALNTWDVSAVTNLEAAFSGADAFNKPLNNWNVSSVTNMKDTFSRIKLFNQPLNEWNVSSVITMENMFENSEAFNQPLKNWDVSSVTTMKRMLCNTLSFNQNIGDWNIALVENFDCIFSPALSTDNYSATLVGWSQKSVQSNVFIWARHNTYDSTALTAIDILDSNFNWFISDAGLSP